MPIRLENRGFFLETLGRAWRLHKHSRIQSEDKEFLTFDFVWFLVSFCR